MTPKKLAIFVEGQTEVVFTKRLLQEIAGKKRVVFAEHKAKHLSILTTPLDNKNSKKYFVLIVDCANDESVKSRILENRKNLINANYVLVLGLRDLYPHPRSDLDRVSRGLRTGVPTKDIQIDICLAVMEIEAWFLQEQHHYQQIDSSLTIEMIRENIGFNPETDNAELLDAPAQTLRSIYQLAGKSYRKRRRHVERTVDLLDYDNMYINVRDKLPHFNYFLAHVDSFIG